MKKILTPEDIKKMDDYATELLNIDEQIIEIVSSFWYSGTTSTLSENGKVNIKKLLKRYKFEEVLKAMKASMSYIIYDANDNPELESLNKAFNKINTICNANRSDTKYEGDLKIVYIKGIIKNKLMMDDFYKDNEILTLLRHMDSKGVSREEMRDISKTITSWSDMMKKFEEAKTNKEISESPKGPEVPQGHKQ